MQAQSLMSRGLVWHRVCMTAIAVAILTCSIAATSRTKKEADMNPKEVQQEGFTVVGIAVRTNNAKEATGEGAIGKQWGRLMGESLLEKIPNRADGNIVALYTEYASDKDGEYTYVLGAHVSSPEDVPAGMVAKRVPPGRFAVFTSEKGPVQKVVVEMWQKVWATPKSKLGGDRAYKADFEVYDQRARNPAEAVVDLYIGVR
jgi:predicted transcriptional regulator YdeE